MRQLLIWFWNKIKITSKPALFLSKDITSQPAGSLSKNITSKPEGF